MGPLSSVSVSTPNLTQTKFDASAAKPRDDIQARKESSIADLVGDVLGKAEDKSFKRQQEFADAKIPVQPQQTGQRRGNLLDLVI